MVVCGGVFSRTTPPLKVDLGVLWIPITGSFSPQTHYLFSAVSLVFAFWRNLAEHQTRTAGDGSVLVSV